MQGKSDLNCSSLSCIAELCCGNDEVADPNGGDQPPIYIKGGLSIFGLRFFPFGQFGFDFFVDG